eukprot:GHVP01021408.1.p1 GENE.GHVP01021408.1~~GHVP01021408.1.p1  ORF type:complete len:775 (+),score=118.45 GHVP01021408.1:14-2338(+)
MSDICKDFQDGYCRLGKKCRKKHSFLIFESIKGSLKDDDREEMKDSEYCDDFFEDSATRIEDKEHIYDSCETKEYLDASEDSATMVEDKDKDYYDLSEESDITIEDRAYYDLCDVTIENPVQYDLSEESDITVEDTTSSDLTATKESIGNDKEIVTIFEDREYFDDRFQTSGGFNTLESTEIVETKEHGSDRCKNTEYFDETKENVNPPENTHLVDISEIKEAAINLEGTCGIIISETKEFLNVLKDKSLEGFVIEESIENKTITKYLENVDTEKDSKVTSPMGNLTSKDDPTLNLNRNDGKTEESTNETLCDSITTLSVIDDSNINEPIDGSDVHKRTDIRNNNELTDYAPVSDLNIPYASNNEPIDDNMEPIDSDLTNQDSEAHNNTNGNIESEQEDSYISITNSQEEYYYEDAEYMEYSSSQMNDEEHSPDNEDIECQTISDKPPSLLSGYAESPTLSRPLPLQTVSLIQNTFPQQSASNLIICPPLSTPNINNSSSNLSNNMIPSNPSKGKPSFRFGKNKSSPNKPAPLNAKKEYKPAIICADYSRGRCYKADKCEFNHPVWMNVRQKGSIDERYIGTSNFPRVLNTKRGESLVRNSYYKEGSMPNRNANDRIGKTITKPKGSTLQEYNELRQEIRTDLLQKRPSWPFSGYNPTDKTYSVFRGDISPEELRFTAYIEIYCKGNIGNYNKTVKNMKSKVNENIGIILKEVNSIAKTIRTMDYSNPPIWKSIHRKENLKADKKIIKDMKSMADTKECVAFEYGKIPETPPEY